MSIQADSEERLEIEMQASQMDKLEKEKSEKEEKSPKPQPPWISSK